MEAKEIIKKIAILEDKITNLRNEYQDIVTPCQNRCCNFFNEIYKNNCSWTWFVGECPEYKEE